MDGGHVKYRAIHRGTCQIIMSQGEEPRPSWSVFLFLISSCCSMTGTNSLFCLQ